LKRLFLRKPINVMPARSAVATARLEGAPTLADGRFKRRPAAGMVSCTKRLPAVLRARHHGVGTRRTNSLGKKFREPGADSGEIASKKQIPFGIRGNQACAEGG